MLIAVEYSKKHQRKTFVKIFLIVLFKGNKRGKKETKAEEKNRPSI